MLLHLASQPSSFFRPLICFLVELADEKKILKKNLYDELSDLPRFQISATVVAEKLGFKLF